MPFAGHPTLGTAHVVRALRRAGDRVVLEMQAGLVEVTGERNAWTLRAARPPEARPPEALSEELAALLGLPSSAVKGPPMWVDTGSEQLVVPLASEEAVRSAQPRPVLMAKVAHSTKRGQSLAYVWAEAGDGEAVARFFFLSRGSVVEDPATGSACANLGGWMPATGHTLPCQLLIRQGQETGRPARLVLRVDARKRIYVTGEVLELGAGEVSL
jgi:PhzF family phenazine biosynthesis protein